MNESTDTSALTFRQRLQHFVARSRTPLLFFAGVAAALLAVLLYQAVTPPPKQLTSREVNDAIVSAMASATPPPAFSVGVHRAVMPSLVLVQTEGHSADKRATADGDPREDKGLGTGVVINDKGDILTSLHVVKGASEVKVTFADGTESVAFVVTEQPENDIAVLQALQPPAQIIPATLGNPGSLRVGDEVYAVGNPLGLYGSMSAGVVSGLKRSFKPDENGVELKELIQFDAAVNPGNSGGPLLNRYGQVVGIVAALVNPSGADAFSGIGFAVPINAAGGAAGMPPY